MHRELLVLVKKMDSEVISEQIPNLVLNTNNALNALSLMQYCVVYMEKSLVYECVGDWCLVSKDNIVFIEQRIL